MKFTHILGLSSIHAIGMATKMVRKAKEQHCKKKQVFVRFIHWNANKRSCYQILRSLRKIWFAGKTAKKLGRPAQNYFLISNSKIQKQFFGKFVIPDRKSREKNSISSDFKRTPQSRKYIFPIQIVDYCPHWGTVNYWTKSNRYLSKWKMNTDASEDQQTRR